MNLNREYQIFDPYGIQKFDSSFSDKLKDRFGRLWVEEYPRRENMIPPEEIGHPLAFDRRFFA